MDSLTKFIKTLIECFEKEGLDYAFTGALAVSYYGVPRTTSDIDIIVAIPKKNTSMKNATKAKLVLSLCNAGLEVQEKKIDDALSSGYKIATFYCKTSPYRVDVIFSEEVHKQIGEIVGAKTSLQVPEDLISAKLRMIQATLDTERAVKDERDIHAILRFTRVNRDTVRRQAEKDGTLEVWRRFLND